MLGVALLLAGYGLGQMAGALRWMDLPEEARRERFDRLNASIEELEPEDPVTGCAVKIVLAWLYAMAAILIGILILGGR